MQIKQRREARMGRETKILMVGFLLFTFGITMLSLSYAQKEKPKEIKQIQPEVKVEQPPLTPMIHDLEARLPVCTRRPISGDRGVFILRGAVCNVGNVDHVSPPHAPAHAKLIVRHIQFPTLTIVRRIVLGSQTITRLNKGQCINIDSTHEVPGVIRWENVEPGQWTELREGECRERVHFDVLINQDPVRIDTFAYPDSNHENNITGKTMQYIIRCPR
jgi:hypothetical protein